MNTRILFPILLLLLALSVSANAEAISGKVGNVTTSQPAAGDDVILLRLGNGMEEEARAKTDAQGAFTFNPGSPKAQYVVRVIHQGVNYDQTVIGTAPLAIQVFDAVAKIEGLGGTIGIAQVESDGKNVKVTEMYAIANNSSPPVTQAGPHNYDIVLPANAALDAVEARRGEGVWTKAPPAPEQGKPGHYSVNFPFRPGDTLIKFTYHLPYTGPVALHLRLPYPIRKFAVLHPPSIKFKASRAGAFTSPGQANGFQIEAAVKQPMVGDVPAFEISGVGTASPPAATTVAPPAPVPQPPAASAPPVTTAQPDTAAGQPAAPSSSNPSVAPKRESWLVPLAIAGLLMIGAVAFWRMRATSPQPAAAAPALLEALKEELFQLEIDKAKGSISPDEYTATKQALNTTLQRAVEKGKR
jgi:hypothetical protein